MISEDQKTINSAIIEEITDRLAAGKRIRRKLPHGGRLHYDKKLPYILLYRPPEDHDDHGTVRLLLGEAVYLIAPHAKIYEEELQALLKSLGKELYKEFGGFLLMEIWTKKIKENKKQATFSIHAPENKAPSTIQTLVEGLKAFEKWMPHVRIKIKEGKDPHPPHTSPLLTIEEAKEMGCLLLGVGIPPIYQNPATRHIYPVFFRKFRNHFSRLLREVLFDFIRVHTNAGIDNFRMLGSSRPDNIVWEVDKALTAIEKDFQLLMLLSPINADEAWTAFRDSYFTETPNFYYRLLPVDPEELKKQLFHIPIEDVYDPTFAYLFRDKREELDKMLTLLHERGTHNFKYTSLRLFGGVNDDLLTMAKGVLTAIPEPEPIEEETIDCHQFADMAREELDYFREELKDIPDNIEIRKDVNSLMVSKGQLLIGATVCIGKSRARALIQHEVGTHLLTYYNGTEQPLTQLAHGLANYDELQEGLAVLAEYLSGGMNHARLRLLAARVVAVDYMIRGAEFPETFRMLNRRYHFSERTAFDIAMRVFRGGGLSKDAIYLKGLVNMLDYFKKDGRMEPLFVGKIGRMHIDVVDELVDRNILKKPTLMPSYLKDDAAQQRLEKLRKGMFLYQLLETTE